MRAPTLNDGPDLVSADRPLRLLVDDPVREGSLDALGLEPWARMLADVCLGTPGPFTIGVFGGWGVGKTSVLQRAQSLLGDSVAARGGRVTTIWFDAWKYAHEPKPFLALVESILRGLEEQAQSTSQDFDGGSALGRLHDALKTFIAANSVKWTVKLPPAGEIGGQMDGAKLVEGLSQSGENWLQQRLRQIDGHRALEDLRRIRDRSDLHKVVVFVDDLDRCSPRQALGLMERIKIVLNEPAFLFVFAADYQILENFLRHRYGSGADEQWQHAPPYFDKFVQLPMWLPPHQDRFAKLIAEMCERPELKHHQGEVQSLSSAIGLACDFNPRRLVRFLNDLLVDSHVHEQWNRKSLPLDLFVVARGLRHRSESLYQSLRHDDALCDQLSDCQTVARAEELLVPIAKHNSSARELLGHRSLLELLSSDAGKRWLGNPGFRKKVDNILDEWKLYDEKERTYVQDAIVDLKNRHEVKLSCLKLQRSGHPSRFDAIEILNSLLHDESITDPETTTIVARTLAELREARNRFRAGRR
jgi:hypothetical protein